MRGGTRITVFAPKRGTLRWIVDELADEPHEVESVESIGLLVARLTEHPAPQPLVAIADFDAMTGAEIAKLEGLRERGWDGTMIALGQPTFEARAALHIRHVIARPFGSEVLRKAVDEICHDRMTDRIAIAR